MILHILLLRKFYFLEFIDLAYVYFVNALVVILIYNLAKVCGSAAYLPTTLFFIMINQSKIQANYYGFSFLVCCPLAIKAGLTNSR